MNMRVFLTGSTGFIGLQVAKELLGAGHQVLGLTRSEAGAQALQAIGAEPHRGTLQDLGSLQRGAEACDAVIHTAFDHDFDHFVANCQQDAAVIAALGEPLAGSRRPLIVTSATPMGMPGPGQPADEDHFDPGHANPRVASELAGERLLQRGINVMVVRLSQIHNPVRQGLVTEVIQQARARGACTYIDSGLNQWSAAPLEDTARLYRLALEHGQPGVRFHATAEDGIAFRLIAETIGAGLGVPAHALSASEAAASCGWLASFIGKDMRSSSRKTQARLGWHPGGPGLLEDIRRCLAPDHR
jgi:nucleoside-diphosphate-sugar epimerase